MPQHPPSASTMQCAHTTNTDAGGARLSTRMSGPLFGGIRCAVVVEDHVSLFPKAASRLARAMSQCRALHCSGNCALKSDCGLTACRVGTCAEPLARATGRIESTCVPTSRLAKLKTEHMSSCVGHIMAHTHNHTHPTTSSCQAMLFALKM